MSTPLEPDDKYLSLKAYLINYTVLAFTAMSAFGYNYVMWDEYSKAGDDTLQTIVSFLVFLPDIFLLVLMAVALNRIKG